MTDPTPLDDEALDRLLGQVEAPPLSPDFADRVVAEATRAERTATVPPLPPRSRAVRRPWTRRGVWAGVIAINLIVASAIAATLTGIAPRFAHVVAAAAQVLHIHRHEAPLPHVAPPPARRIARAAPAPVPHLAPPLAQFRPAPSRAPILRPWLGHGHFRPAIHADRRLHPPMRVDARRLDGRRWQGAGRADRVAGRRPGVHATSPAESSERIGARGFGHGPWTGEVRRPWAQGWNGPRQQGMRPWRQRGPGGWRRPGRGGGGGVGWRRRFGRGRRF